MDSTPLGTPPPPQSLPVKASAAATASKLPIKRKTLDSASSSSPTPISHPDPLFDSNPNFLSPNFQSNAVAEFSLDPPAGAGAKPPPFKFHRIWTEPDEIRFLQGLLDSASDGLIFPRDLHIFYDRFSNTMSQPYSKSQLSEKLRRLRKKFRVISSRLARGLDPSMLSPHDRALYDLSKKLWSPEFSSISPFVGNSSQGSANCSKNRVENDSIGINLSFSHSLPHSTNPKQNDHCDAVGISVDGDRMSESNVDCDASQQNEDLYGSNKGYSDGKLGGVSAKTVLDVFDQSMKEAKMALSWQGILYSNNQAKTISSTEENAEDFGRRWQEQQALELEVYARRLRLVLENSLHQH